MNRDYTFNEFIDVYQSEIDTIYNIISNNIKYNKYKVRDKRQLYKDLTYEIYYNSNILKSNHDR